MSPARPMLGEIELQQVQTIEVDGDQVLVEHGVPALEGDYFQGLGRRATQVTLTGVLTGPESGEGLRDLREKFRAAEPVPFVADIATATRVDEVLIEEMGVRELAGKPERFEYAFTLREYTAPPAPEVEEPPEPDLPDPPDDDIDDEVGTLIVEVIVEGQPGFDFSRVTVTARGTQEDGTDLSRTLTNREDNTWTEEAFPAGQYTVEAVVTELEAMSGAEPATVRAGQTTQVTITLRPGAMIAKAFMVHFWFDKAFVEPCMGVVLRQVAQYAQAHADEKLVIVGHTDLVGSGAYNQSLSERRGRSVYAYLTFGRDQATALNEWDQLRRARPAGTLPSINDTWGTREYQCMLQELGYYPGNVDEVHGPATDAAVRAFQGDQGLTADGVVGDDTWAALIEAYMNRDGLAVPESQFLPNCEGEILKWLGCGEQDPVRNTQDAWRPNRRTELLFVRADALPCEVAQPETYDLPAAGAVGSGWCLGPGDPNQRCCFTTRGR
jgi:outer membrane protein OmpA-like peptidoglycan-associated protein